MGPDTQPLPVPIPCSLLIDAGSVGFSAFLEPGLSAHEFYSIIS